MKNELQRNEFTKNESAYIEANYPAYADGWTPINKAAALQLFDSMAEYIGGDDCVSFNRCYNLFGAEPMRLVKLADDYVWKGADQNTKPYIKGCRNALYLTRKGFMYAVEISNDHMEYTQNAAYYAARSADYDEFCEADEARYRAAEEKRKAAAQKRRATLEKKKAADLDHQQA